MDVPRQHAHPSAKHSRSPPVPKQKFLTPHPIHTISILSHSCGFRAPVGRYASGSRSNRRLGLGPVTQASPTQSKNGIGHHPEILPLPKLLFGVKRPAHPNPNSLNKEKFKQKKHDFYTEKSRKTPKTLSNNHNKNLKTKENYPRSGKIKLSVLGITPFALHPFGGVYATASGTPTLSGLTPHPTGNVAHFGSFSTGGDGL